MFFSSFPEKAVDTVDEAYDYIIIGGGTAGCVLANRLSTNEGVSVLLVERGGVEDNWISQIPLFAQIFKVATDRSLTRAWKTVPQKYADERVFELTGGKSLGGASKINAMLYTRGLPAEYNSWSAAGCEGWSYDDLQPYFIKSETDLDQDPLHAEDFHGTSGEWCNRSHQGHYWGHSKYIIEAAKSLGIPYVDDLNSPLHPSHGCAKMHYNIDGSGKRSSTLSAFLPRKLVNERRNRLHVCTQAIVSKIDVKKGADGMARAEGVFLQSANGRVPSRFIRAREEVVVTAGPIGSPQILMLSGIGPAEHLKKHAIAVIKDNAAVGAHMQDHMFIPVQFRVPLADSLIKLQMRPWLLLKEIFLYMFYGIGLLLAPVLELSIFVQSRLFDSDFRTVTQSKADEDAALPANLPDIEIMPIAWSDLVSSKSKGDGGLVFLAIALRPTSLGTVRLASSDPLDDPIIDPQYLSTEHDRVMMRKTVRFALRLGEQVAAQGYPIVSFEVPASEKDEDVDAFVRKWCHTSFHYTSTCRMAPESENGIGGVVDERLRVHGVWGLRIADSSIFPHILSAHTAAATVAVAEKCADMIKEDRGSKEAQSVSQFVC